MAISCRRSDRRIAAPDLVTNASFPTLAAEALGVSREEGLDAHAERLRSLDAVNARRDGAVDSETIKKLGVRPSGAPLPFEFFDYRPGHARSPMTPNVWHVVPRMSQSALF
jgi:hypothetical protein